MNTPERFEQQISDWLEDGPTDAPDATLEAVLSTFPSLSQRRVASRLPWGTASGAGVLRGFLGVAAAVAIAAGALVVLPRLMPGGVGGPPAAILGSPSASPSATPSVPPTQPPSSPAGPATSAPTVAPPTPGVAAGACLSSFLDAQVMDWQGAAGTRFGTIRLQNTGTVDCLVSGTPGLQLIDGQGRMFLDSASLGEPPKASPAKPVLTLRPGGADSVYLEAGLTNFCGADPVAPVRIALVLPGGAGTVVAIAPVSVAITMAPCNGPTQATVLHVQQTWSTTAP